jgi:hypothetical protein
MPHANPLRPERWQTFDDAEVGVISSALSVIVDGLMDTASVADMTPDERDGAAASLVIAGRLLYSISEHNCEQHPPLSVLENVARAVASGSVPERTA